MDGDEDEDEKVNIRSEKFNPLHALYSNKSIESDEEDDKDETLNVQSDKFNPLHALYSKELVVPFPNAPALDNIAKVTYLLSTNQNLLPKDRIKTVKVKKEEEPTTSNTAEVKSKSDSEKGAMSKKSPKNVLTRMAETKGPLAFLKNCMEKRIRVKVWTRNASGIRGHCMGFIAAFDKHWNLALQDVHEVWTRKTKRKKILLGEATHEIPLGWRAMGPVVKPPKVVVTKKEKGRETCERHVNQMLMRGEHIAFISVPDT